MRFPQNSHIYTHGRPVLTVKDFWPILSFSAQQAVSHEFVKKIKVLDRKRFLRRLILSYQ